MLIALPPLMLPFNSTSLLSPTPGQNEWFRRRHGVNGRKQQFPPGLSPARRSAAAWALRLQRALITLLLLLTLESAALPVAPAAALSVPWRPQQANSRPVHASRGIPPLQEVSPPEAVQQLQSALGARQPVVEIVSPQPDSLLPAGPWTLRLRVHDWPLVDGGNLGVGPHLVVQLDQEPPRIWTRSEGEMPELSPGSHRLTVYAALPWGEARKNPGAVRQIRLHRSTANPLALPATGSPQLLAVSPSGPVGGEPLLLDWLLLDAPLQDVGGRGTQWRLRVSINGDAVLLDQQSPLWLRGWRPGPNALQLELLDGRGEPLNPPFNSLVQEVELSTTATMPRWRRGPLSTDELAILLGAALPPPAAERGPDTAAPTSALQPSLSGAGATPLRPAPIVAVPLSSTSSPSGGTVGAPTPAAPRPVAPAPASAPRDFSSEHSDPGVGQAGSTAEGQVTLSLPQQGGRSPAEPVLEPLRADGQASVPSPDAPFETGAGRESDAMAPEDEQSLIRPITTAQQTPDLDQEGPAADPNNGSEAEKARSSGFSSAEPPEADAPTAAASTAETPESARKTAMAAAAASRSDPDRRSNSTEAAQNPPQDSMPPAPATPSAPPTLRSEGQNDTQPGDDEGRIRPSTALTGRARDLVNDDGTLRRPERRGPIAGLLERLQR